jgi:hypothetical protein
VIHPELFSPTGNQQSRLCQPPSDLDRSSEFAPGLCRADSCLGYRDRFGRYDGPALILVGLAPVVVAATRFVRTRRWLDDPEMHSAGSIRAELYLSTALAVIVAGFSTFSRARLMRHCADDRRELGCPGDH